MVYVILKTSKLFIKMIYVILKILNNENKRFMLTLDKN